MTCFHSSSYLPDVDPEAHPPFVSLKSTDNISIESGWSYWQKAKGRTLREIICSGPANGFIVGNQLHGYVLHNTIYYTESNGLPVTCSSGFGQRLSSDILTISNIALITVQLATSAKRSYHLGCLLKLFWTFRNDMD